MPEASARLRYLRTAPTKVRQVLGLIRGLDVEDARETLEFCERGAADEVLKLLDSAIANAEHNQHLPVDELFVQTAFVDEGPTLKRWRPRARGRGTRIRKRTSHLTIIVSRFAEEELERRRALEAITGPPRKRPPRRRGLQAQVEAEQGEAEEHDHDHDHDEPDEGVTLVDEEGAPIRQAPAKKKAPTKKKAPAKKKSTAKKTTKKTTKKSTKKKGT